MGDTELTGCTILSVVSARAVYMVIKAYLLYLLFGRHVIVLH